MAETSSISVDSEDLRIRDNNERTTSSGHGLNRTSSGLRATVPTATEAEDLGQDAVFIIRERQTDNRAKQLSLLSDKRESRAKGVVQRTEDKLTTVSVLLEGSRTEIQVSRMLIPDALSEYGTPVWISVDNDGGFNRLHFEKREATGLDLGSEYREVADWLDKLE